MPRCKSEYSSDGIPAEARHLARQLLREVFPELAERTFSYERLCWDGDTLDAHFLITPHPQQRNLFIAGGGCAHAFKFLSIIGKHTKAMVEGKLQSHLQQAWRWRPDTVPRRDLARPDADPLDLSEVSGWAAKPVAKL